MIKKINKVFISVFLLLPCLLSCKKVNKTEMINVTNDNSYFEKKYEFGNPNISLYRLEITSFLDDVSSKNYSGIVLFTKDDCAFCQELFSLFQSYDGPDTKIDVIESDNMSIHYKELLEEELGVTVVPTLIVFSKGKSKKTEIGVPDLQCLKEILGGY